MWKKCKVVILPTNGKAILGLGLSKQGVLVKYDYTVNIENDQYFQKQHLYILSDDAIKEGDWYYNYTLKRIVQAVVLGHQTAKKIIASTDSSLTVKDTTKEVYGKSPDKLLPSIPQSFIDLFVSEYNKGHKIEEIMVEYEKMVMVSLENDEKLVKHGDSFLELKLNPDNTINIKSIKDSWTREEVIGMLNQVNVLSCYRTDFDLEEWIKDNLY